MDNDNVALIGSLVMVAVAMAMRSVRMSDRNSVIASTGVFAVFSAFYFALGEMVYAIASLVGIGIILLAYRSNQKKDLKAKEQTEREGDE